MVMRRELTTGWVRKRTRFSAQLGDGRRTSAPARLQSLQYAFQGIGAKIGNLVLQGFLSRQSEELAFLDEAGDFHIRVDHRLGDERGALAAFGGRAKLCAHEGYGFLLHWLRGAARLSDVHRSSGADRSAVGHDDLLGGQSDKSAGRDRALVYKGHRPNLRIQQSVADENRRIQPPAESIDLENNGGGTYVVGFVKDALNERR